jgi:ASC-1-like (ASCH) protein
MNCHLVILKRPYLESILNGDKTIELRLTKTKPAVFGRVLPGDKLFLKASGGPVYGAASVSYVEYHANLTPKQIRRLKLQHHHAIRGSDAVWDSLMNRKYGFLVWLANVRRIDPIYIEKKDLRAWVMLTPGKDFGLLASMDDSSSK